MAIIQEISARIRRTTGRGISANIRQHYPNWVLQGIVALLIVANTINIGADLDAMSDAVNLLTGDAKFLYVVGFGVLCATLQVLMQYSRYVSVLKWLTLALFAYFGTVLVVKVPWGEAARGFFVTTFSGDVAFWTTVVAVLGTTITRICSSGKPPRKWKRSRKWPSDSLSCQGARARAQREPEDRDRYLRRHGAFKSCCPCDHDHHGCDAAPQWNRQRRNLPAGSGGVAARLPATLPLSSSPLASWGPACSLCQCWPVRPPMRLASLESGR
jgi:hypothetical protein